METEHVHDEDALSFGPFVFCTLSRKLLLDGHPVRLGGRAIDILGVLLERAGQIVSKRELIAFAWPETFVDDGNLRVHIAALRKALSAFPSGSSFILNSAGRGYVFTAPLSRTRWPPIPPLAAEPPRAAAAIFGRGSALRQLESVFDTRHLVTITGPGGIGKSTIADALAGRVALRHNYDRCFVDLGTIEEGAAVASAVATALGVSVADDDPVTGLLEFLRDRSLLLVLDNCEHVIEAAATLAEQIAVDAPTVDILATSREPLRVVREWIFRLDGLELPAAASAASREHALQSPAVQLFLARAGLDEQSETLASDELTAIVEVCRELDGLPLAIELVAAQVGLYGPRGLQAALDDGLLMAARGRRTGQPRQQSLRAMLDWSVTMLSDDERRVLRRLAVFRGPFRLDDAVAVVDGGEALCSPEVIISLAARSLVATDTYGRTVRYRLLHITRTYAMEKLVESGESAEIQRRHALQVNRLFTVAQSSWDSMTRSEWLAAYEHAIHDVRAALDWAFSSNGDILTGAELTANALPFGYQLSLIDEFRIRIERALAALPLSSPATDLVRCRLSVALGVFHLNMAVDMSAAESILREAAVLSERLGAVRFKVEPLLVRAIFCIEQGDYAGAVTLTDRLTTMATEGGDPLAGLLADRAGAQATHMAGDHRRARGLADHVLRYPTGSIPLTYGQASVDRRASMRIILARIDWIEGFPERAVRRIDEAIAIATDDGPFALCQVLALGAVPIAMWNGDDSRAGKLVDQLLEQASRYTLHRWRRLGECYYAAHRRRVDPDDASGSVERWGAVPAGALHRDLLVTIDERTVHPGVIGAPDCRAGWCLPELLRATAEMHRRLGGVSAVAVAEEHLRASLAIARRQKALSWELRAAMSLASIRMGTNRAPAATTALRALVERFPEGRGTADLRRAAALIERLERR